MEAVDIRVLLSLIPRPEDNEPGNEAKYNYTGLECNMILLAHWLACVCQECSYNQETNTHSVSTSTLELQYKELVTNVTSSSSGFILNFDISSYVEVPDSQKWNSIFVAYLAGITGCLPPRSCM